MFIRIKKRSNGKKVIQIVETFRSGSKVRQKVIRHVGQATIQREIDVLKGLAESILIEMKNKKRPLLSCFSPEEFYKQSTRGELEDKVKIKNLREEARIIEGIYEVFGKLYKELGFNNIISKSKKNHQWNKILEHCVMARLANPMSKRKSSQLLEKDFGINIPLEKIYRMMDWVAVHEDDIKKQAQFTTLDLLNNKVDVLFFDVTTLYFESTIADELRNFGFSKDCKFKETQVVLALISTTQGLPISYKLFPGNMYEGKTLSQMIQQLKNEYLVKDILLVADRAMFTNDNINLMEEEGINFIVAAKLKALSREVKTHILDMNNYRASAVEGDLHWVKELSYKGNRLIVSYNSKRAKKDASDRKRLIDRLMKKTKDKKICLKDLIPNYGSKKYITITQGKAEINFEKINKEEQWDGLHGVITNVDKKSANEILARYKGLWQIEEAFRINKHDLKMRPIYHWTPKRIKAHIAICFIAFTLVKQIIYKLKQSQIIMSFEQIKNELLHVQASIIVDIKSLKKYVIPSKMTKEQKVIYNALNINRCESPYLAKQM